MAGALCRSLYAFSGEQHERGLCFQPGELIRVTRALPGGWWEGEKDGVTGWFPSSYVQVVEVRVSAGDMGLFVVNTQDWLHFKELSVLGKKPHVC